jgi:hypothetical protein
MPNGKLVLSVLDVYGKPIAEKVDIFLKNQKLSDAPSFRDSDVSKKLELTGLNVFPNGLYSLEIDALSYQTVSRFVSIPPGGSQKVTITLPVNPKKVIRVDFREYGSPTIPDDARALLERSPHVLNFQDLKGELLYDALDDIRRAGFLNLVAKANRTVFPVQEGKPRSVLSYIQELSELRGDRFFATIPADLRSQTINSLHSQLFHEVDELLHTPPPGFSPARSFKTQDHYGNLQLSFFSGAGGQYALDMDIDDAQGFDHIFQVVGNLIGGPTHPYNIHEILIASQELDPGYRLVLREVAARAAGA